MDSAKEKAEHLGSSDCYLDLALRRDGDKWIASGDVGGEFAFSGEGVSIAEAIGQFMISNRERLKFQFGFENNGQVKLSTVFGRGRSKDEMGANEQRYLSR